MTNKKLTQKEQENLIREDMRRAMKSFPYFVKRIWTQGIEDAVPAPHQVRWAKAIQDNTHVAFLAARNHLKSTTVYAFVAWLIFRTQKKDLEILYLSYKKDLAAYHTKNIKKAISKIPYFDHIQDLTPAESIIRMTSDRGAHEIEVKPDGVLAFKRGRHPDVVICDDILADPANSLNPTVILKINRVFNEDIINLPKRPHGRLLLVGTPQDRKDLFFQLKAKSERFYWSNNPAIINEDKGEVLWPELWPLEVLKQVREETGAKSFSKEYMCNPVRGEEMFFTLQQIQDRIDKKLKNLNKYDGEDLVVGGWDLGKKRHPSHIAIFRYDAEKQQLIQIKSMWLDNMDYTQQIAIVKTLIKQLKVDLLYFDNTRGELEMQVEQRALPRQLQPLTFKVQLKNTMATEFEKCMVNTRTRLRLIDDERQTDQIMQVDNNLQAMESEQGHGDSFWSNAMACYAYSILTQKNTGGGGTLI